MLEIKGFDSEELEAIAIQWMEKEGYRDAQTLEALGAVLLRIRLHCQDQAVPRKSKAPSLPPPKKPWYKRLFG